MAELLTDTEIASLLQERKKLPSNWRNCLTTRAKQNVAHRERDYNVVGEHGNQFTLWIRESVIDEFDFTVGLRLVRGGMEWILRRYNGTSHRHTNHVERDEGLPNSSFSGVFHIHTATERYQRKNKAIDGFAEPSNTFSSLSTAIREMINNNGFFVEQSDIDPSGQLTLRF